MAFLHTGTVLTTLLLLTSLNANADDLSKQGNSTLREMNEDLVEELNERTGIKHSIPNTLKVSMSKRKVASDKQKLIDNLNRLENIKGELNTRVADRKNAPSYNDIVAITINNVHVTGPRNYYFPNASTTPVFTITRGDQVTNIIHSDFENVRKNTGYSIVYRAVYGEDGSVILNGTKIENQPQSKVAFTVDVDDRDFMVNANVSISKSGWN
ncbi:hypothetical protein [Marinomonas algarum]|uniref:Uncharacterized protein n=1 Tax=Marinomonas algarum TaxID=2883105 RepID=A0A9X1IJ46_9GAMM|nr:hypothetical protein [Marinomonas algarum]MCB5160464.1 hypothetical protein [Marinomonas algarum]